MANQDSRSRQPDLGLGQISSNIPGNGVTPRWIPANWDSSDVTHVFCGRDGWAHLAVVLDCHDRECIGWEFARRGRAKEAERAIEEACLARFGTLRPTEPPRSSGATTG